MNSDSGRTSGFSEDLSNSGPEDPSFQQIASLKQLLSSPASSNGSHSPAGNGTKSTWGLQGLRRMVKPSKGKNIESKEKENAKEFANRRHPGKSADDIAKAMVKNETVSPEEISSTELLEALIADAEKHLKSSTSNSSTTSSTDFATSFRFPEVEGFVARIFSSLSFIRDAYNQVQSAHLAKDPSKLDIADKAVVSELKRISELEKTYKEKFSSISSDATSQRASVSSDSDNSKMILKSYEGLISTFHSDIEQKNAILDNLKEKLAHTTLEKEKFERRAKRLEQKLSLKDMENSPPKTMPQNDKLGPTVQLLESVIMEAAEASRTFTKLLMSLMQMTKWDLEAAAEAIQPGIHYVDPKHRKFAFQSFVRHRMLIGFESENFFLDGILPTVLDPESHRKQCFKEFQEFRAADPLQIVIDQPDGMFGRYCLNKFEEVIHSKMEEVFFGNLEMREQIQQGMHPKSHFYHSFLQLGKAMWLLHRLSFSFEPNVRIFQSLRDTEFSSMYMESVVPMEPQTSSVSPKVGFTVMPGFLLGKTIIKCQVYISTPMDKQQAETQSS